MMMGHINHRHLYFITDASKKRRICCFSLVSRPVNGSSKSSNLGTGQQRLPDRNTQLPHPIIAEPDAAIDDHFCNPAISLIGILPVPICPIFGINAKVTCSNIHMWKQHRLLKYQRILR